MKLRSFVLFAAALTALPTVAPSSAQAQMIMGGMFHEIATRPGMTGMGHMLGTHVMPITVTSVDAKNGLVEGTAGGTTLRLHFPPESLGGVKTGDQLSVMLAFSK